MSTIFKKIINKEVAARIRYEDDLCIAFDDLNPQAPVHVLLIPKKEISSLKDLKAEDLNLMGHLILKAEKLAQELGLEKGWRLVVNTGDEAGQTVPHIHLHILGGRPMKWPPG